MKRFLLLVVPRGDGTMIAAGAFPVSEVKAIIELRDEV
jgi:hypothetical protein